MKLSDVLLLDFDSEMEKTRKTLERIPADKPDWTPHGKSMPMGRLAMHVATLPGFGSAVLTTSELDFMTHKGPPLVLESREQLLGAFDKSSSELRSQLAAMSDDQLMEHWRMRAGDRVFVDAPRAVLYRGVFLNHLIHHRAQLGVYLRLLDIPVPGTYGPSADEPIAM
jgi:uncharacterized damage-inducible protein DinB